MHQYTYLLNDQQRLVSLAEYVSQCPPIQNDVWKKIPPSLHTGFIQQRHAALPLTDDELIEIIRMNYHTVFNMDLKMVQRLHTLVPYTDALWHRAIAQRFPEHFTLDVPTILRSFQSLKKIKETVDISKLHTFFLSLTIEQVQSCNPKDIAHFFHLLSTQDSTSLFQHAQHHPDFEGHLDGYTIPFSCALLSDKIHKVKGAPWKEIFNTDIKLFEQKPHIIHYFNQSFNTKLDSVLRMEWLANILQHIPTEDIFLWANNHSFILEPWLWLPFQCLPHELALYRQKRNMYIDDFSRLYSDLFKNIKEYYLKHKDYAELTGDYSAYSDHIKSTPSGLSFMPLPKNEERYMKLNAFFLEALIGRAMDNKHHLEETELIL